MTHSYRLGQADESGLIRVVAPNPSPMTGSGTNSWILGHDDVAVIDPGPALPAHLDALTRAVAGRRVAAILVTHSHLDHSPAARPLAERLGAPVAAFGPSDAGRAPALPALRNVGGGEGIDPDFAPDTRLRDGDAVAGDGWTLRAHWTPGHMANHLSFEWPEARTVFTGDTVMAWASTMISPPDGDLGQFMSSLDLLERLQARRFLSGHGDAIPDPGDRCRTLRDHRLMREAAILDALPDAPTIPLLVAALYIDTPPTLHAAAARNVLAHLIHLARNGRVAPDPAIAPDAVWHRT